MKLQGFVVCGHSVSMGVGTYAIKTTYDAPAALNGENIVKSEGTFPATTL